jgi:hypothetical protein
VTALGAEFLGNIKPWSMCHGKQYNSPLGKALSCPYQGVFVLSDHEINISLLVIAGLTLIAQVPVTIIAINEHRTKSAGSLFQHSFKWWVAIIALEVVPLGALGFIAMIASGKADLSHVAYLFVGLAVVLLILMAIARSLSASVMPLQPVLIDAASVPCEVIDFDYFPASPLEHGWKVAYFDKRIRDNPDPAAKSDYLKTRQWKIASNPPSEGCVIIDIEACAIDYRIQPRSALSTSLICDFSFLHDAMLFVLVGLITRDGSQTGEGYIKFDLGREQPRYVEQYKEWVLPTAFQSLGNGWHHVNMSLPEAVSHTWGQAGWLLKELRAIRVRGHFGISPIKLY